MRLSGYYKEALPEILELFYRTVHIVNRADYSQIQLDAWAPAAADEGKWHASLSAHYTVLAWEENELAGFGDIDGSGYLDRLYVAAGLQGRGTGRLICSALEAYAADAGADRITVHASVTAKGFFERLGYRTERERQAERAGVILTNYLMSKPVGLREKGGEKNS